MIVRRSVKDMPNIRINRTPAGEAPEHIRQARVGLVLPLANDKLSLPDEHSSAAPTEPDRTPDSGGRPERPLALPDLLA